MGGFVSSHAKVERARVHLQELDAEARDWRVSVSDTKRIRLVKEVDTDDGKPTYRLPDNLPRPPDRLSLVVGDALHNLRSALDAAAWTLVEDGDEPGATRDGRARSIGFPIYLKASEFHGERASKLPGVSDRLVDVVESHQPFAWRDGPTEDSPLAVLSRASKEDKHRRLHVATAVMRGFALDVVGTFEAGTTLEVDRDERDVGGDVTVDPKSVRVVFTIGTLDVEPKLHVDQEGPLVPAFGDEMLTPALLWAGLDAVEAVLRDLSD